MDTISFGAQSRIDHTRTVRFRIVRITAPSMYVLYTTNCHGGSRFLRVAGEFHILTICQDNKDIICVLRPPHNHWIHYRRKCSTGVAIEMSGTARARGCI